MAREQREALLHDLERSETDLNTSLVSLMERQEQLHQCETQMRDAKDRVLLEFLDCPKDLGANEAARDASIRSRVRQEQQAFDAAEFKIIGARADLERAKVAFQHLRQRVALLTTYGEEAGE